MLKVHWNTVYSNTPREQLGWYEARSNPSLELIERCSVSKDDLIVDIGSGISILIENLLAQGYRNLCAVDISEVALRNAQSFLGEERASWVKWMVDDITKSQAVIHFENVTLWHDRAVFHFLTEKEQRENYHSVMRKVVKKGGFIIMAAFALDAAEKCSGLPVKRYSIEQLCAFVGEEFQLKDRFEYTYTMPSGGKRPYVYACFQRK